MRRKIKAQVLALTDTLIESLTYMGGHDDSSVPILRSGCFDCIAQLSKQLEGEWTEESRSIRDRCGEAVLGGDYKQAEIMTRALSEWIEANVIPKAEVVFLPYKAAMWDSLDSVWREASADPRCNVRTIPIPYYTLGPERKILSTEYEGLSFPEYVPITDYRKYDISRECPDVIFIHNPYDKYNKVTRVYGDYYSSNLIKYTKKLVYIPYYVILEELSKGLYMEPGVYLSWRTFVQSEYIRKEYFNLSILKPDQIVAAGSPKIDYVYKKEAERSDVPESWKPALHDRKVFLYNTSLTPFLKSPQNTLMKMRSLFSIFERRQDIAVIWRPHPLLEATIKSMHPELLSDYLEVVGEFKNLQNGVYDESSETYSAITASCAYLGDYSSLEILYGVTGRPMMILKPENAAENGDDNLKLSFFGGAVSEGFLWFSAMEFNGIFKLKLSTGKLDFVAHFKGEKPDRPNLYSEAVIYKDNCWFVPCNSEKLAMLDLKTLRIREYSLPPAFECFRYVRFSSCVAKDRYLWMVPSESNMVVRLDMETGEVSGYDRWPGGFEIPKQGILFTDGVMIGDSLWLSPCDANMAIELDTRTGEMKGYRIGSPQKKYGGAVYDGQALWFIPRAGGGVLKFDPKTAKTTEYSGWPEEVDSSKPLFNRGFYDGKSVWMIPLDSDMLVKLDPSTGEMEEIKGLPEGFSFGQKGEKKYYPAFGSAITDGDTTWVTPGRADKLLSINRKTEEVSGIEVNLPLDWYRENIQGKSPYADSSKISLNHVYTDDIYTARYFIDMVCKGGDGWEAERRQDFCGKISNSDGTSGKKIWKYVADRLDLGSK